MPPSAAARASSELDALERPLWWNSDYLALLGRRLRLDRVRIGIDVGCGRGLWGRTLLPLLDPSATVFGIDAEPANVELAVGIATAQGLSKRLTYGHGFVEKLDFEDGAFDLVTCQTLLIHVADVDRALREMLRVLRSGGTMLVVEPNNQAGFLVENSLTAGADIERILSRLRFFLVCQRGKAALGEGAMSVGDELPNALVGLGLEDVNVFINDKALPLLPPFDSPEQQLVLATIDDQRRRQVLLGAWPREIALRYFLAGGGSTADFEREWRTLVAASAEIDRALEEKAFSSPGGRLVYAISGTKPAGGATPAGDL